MIECQPVLDFHFFGSLVLMIFFGQITHSAAFCTQTTGGVYRFGTTCNFRCHCLNNEQCDFETGVCKSGCDYEWTGPDCQYKNTALGKESRHSSNIRSKQYSYLANDRVIETCSFTAEATKTKSEAPWWALWFPDNVTFKEFIFITKETHLQYFRRFNVTVQEGVTHAQHNNKEYKHGQLCYRQNSLAPNNTTVHVKCITSLVGNQLRIQIENTNSQLVLCDVRVYGDCKDRMWGSPCENVCGHCHNLSPCDVRSGNCSNGCELGYKSTFDCAKVCDTGTYGRHCSENCSDNCKHKVCDKENGTCTDGCILGYLGDKCDQECDNGTYGFKCRQNCSANCDIVCNKTDGTCSTCKSGWIGDNCTTDCNDGTYGINCQNNCSANCDVVCNKTDGTCSTCKSGWIGDNCTTNCNDGTYGINCQNNCSANCDVVCNKTDGTCSTCKSGWIGDNCTTECDNGTYGFKCQQNCSAYCDVVCNKIDGTCSTCKSGWIGDNCTTECENGSYGKSCRRNCSENCVDVCNKKDGTCSFCAAGWTGHNCTTDCNDGTYGINCQNNCSANCDVVCNKTDGTCSTCKSGWTGDNCTTDCNDGTYGINCQNNCSANCDVVCNKTDGTCSTCKSGWIGDNCTIGCNDGTYGVTCQNNCSANCDVVCNKTDGTCSTCKSGWTGDNCTEDCNDGTYGINCKNKCSANCDVVCNKTDGTCSTCKSGWIGDNCTTSCNDGTFGVNCQTNCSANCDALCNKTDGTCSTCKSGWIGGDCTEECRNGTYGIECKSDCGMCKQTSHCHKVTGICFDGCLDGYRGRFCVEKVSQLFPVSEVASGASGVVVFAALVVVGLLCLRKRKQSQRSSTYKSMKESILNPAIATEDAKHSRNSEICQNKYCNELELEERLQNSEDVKGPKESEVNECEYANDTAPVCTKTDHEVLVSNLKDYVKKGLADKRYFEDEFPKIPYGMQYPATVATNPKNVGKNRYKSMYAYDHSRVVLKKQSHNGSDYINATNIMGYSCGNSYIAAQGPIKTTLDDFWRMIWEKKIRTIIMATNLSEEGKMKCIQYWPEISQTAQYGNLSIVMESEDKFTERVVRRLKVSHEGKPVKQRIVTQFHYRAWPDKSVPRCTSSLLHFWYQVRKHDAKKAVPWLVHCSAGVGRTGTFIALDILYEEGSDKGSIDVYRCVSTLREQRVNMVQTKDQYKFLHTIMVEALVLAWKPIIVDRFPSVYDELREVDQRTGKTQLLLQYESLNDEPEVETEQEQQDELYSSAKRIENRDKNRYDNILAPNEFRPFLYTRVPGCTDYINAIYIPGYRRKHAYIITQTPLMTTAVDCCRLLIEEEVKVIVTFEDCDSEEVGEYLPERGAIKIGPFTTTFVSEEDKKHSILRNFEVKFESQKHSITQLIFKHWLPLKLTPTNANEMLYFLEEIERLQRLTDNKPILIQCLDGAERSGLVAVLLNILERVRFDEEVSIIQVVRQLKVRRQQIIPNFEQYKFCHDVLLSHVQSNSAYANM